MIVINKNNEVLASSTSIERVNEQNEIGLIKVHADTEHFWYIGTTDRDTYQIIDGVLAPDSNLYKWIDGQFVVMNTQSATSSS